MNLLFILGIPIGFASVIVDNVGLVFQKLTINRLSEGKKVTRGLPRNKIWLFGFNMNGDTPPPFSIAVLTLVG